MGDFDDSETVSSILSDNTFYSMGDDIFQQPKKKGNDFQKQDNDMTSSDNPENKLSEPLEGPLEMNSGTRKSLC